MIVHIPHSCTKFPTEYQSVADKLSRQEIHQCTDMYTHELFSGFIRWIPNINADQNTSIMSFPYSRLFCDVERLSDDPLDEIGFGIFYTKVPMSSKTYRDKVVDAEQYREVLSVYETWHEMLRNRVLMTSRVYKKRVIVDCHSFSKYQVGIEDDDALPDICVGINDDGSTSEALKNVVVDSLSERGLKVAINYPFGNSIYPKGMADKVDTIMIEVNKSLYLDADHVSVKDPDSSKFEYTQRVIRDTLIKIHKFQQEEYKI